MITVREVTGLDALDFAGAKPFLRKVLLFQARRTEARLVLHDGRPVAIAMFYVHRARRVEYAMFLKPEAAKVMPALVRLAHLTLARFAQDGILVFAHVRESDPRAQRMARLTGFRPGRMRDRTVWLFKGGGR